MDKDVIIKFFLIAMVITMLIGVKFANIYITLETIFLVLGAIGVDLLSIKGLFIIDNLLSNIQNVEGIQIVFKIILILIMIFPWILLKNMIKSTICILYYSINKEKILSEGRIEKGEIYKIKSYDYGKYGPTLTTGYYLIVNLNGAKIRSFYFKRNEYSTGEEIDVILYKNWKFVKLNNMY